MFFVNIIGMIIAVRMYINYSYISLAIAQETQQTKLLQQQIAYLENFHKPYLQSEFAAYFLWHENNRIFAWEQIVEIVYTTVADENNALSETNQAQENISPSKQWDILIQEKLQQIE